VAAFQNSVTLPSRLARATTIVRLRTFVGQDCVQLHGKGPSRGIRHRAKQLIDLVRPR
jgi:hypothetical protein